MQKFRNLFVIFGGIALICVLSVIMILRDNAVLIGQSEFNNIMERESLQNPIELSMDANYLYIQNENSKYKIAKDLVDVKNIANLPIKMLESPSIWSIAGYIALGIVIFIAFGILGGAMRAFRRESVSVAPNQVVPKSNNDFIEMSTPQSVSKITFNDVAGIREVKDDLLEIIDYLKNPKKYQDMGIRLPKGVLLVGPPGVGKTMIAKAIAGEANVPFFYQSGSSFAQIYVGLGAKRVRELFLSAKMRSPSIIFIDEIDAVGKARGGNRNDEREATLNQLLTEMDGFEDSTGVIVIGATNNIEVLDSALLRAGRFDRRIHIDLPDFEDRVNILEIYLKNKKHSVEIPEIARQLVGFSGAGIASLVNEASLNALRRGSESLGNEDFFATKDKMVDGFKKQLSFSQGEKEILALYQAGKALSAYWCDVEFDKIMLLGGHFNLTMSNLLSKTDLMNKIKIALSGNVVLELFGGDIYTNNCDDVALAKDIAREMSEKYAMAGRIITDLSDEQEILNNAADELKVFLKNAKNALYKIRDKLLESEKITKDEIKQILSDEMFV